MSEERPLPKWVNDKLEWEGVPSNCPDFAVYRAPVAGRGWLIATVDNNGGVSLTFLVDESMKWGD